MKDRITHLAQCVYPRLFELLDEAFPEFGWRRTANGWVATNREFTKARLGARPDRVICNEPFGFLVHGGAAQTWLAYVNGGTRPRGREFIAAVRILEARARIESAEQRELRASPTRPPYVGLTAGGAEALVGATRLVLAGPLGAMARDHLKSRGLGDATIAGFGLYTSWREITSRLGPAQLMELQPVLSRGACDRFWKGRVIIPWRDTSGRIVSVVGYQIAGPPPRYLYAPGPRPPLFGLDRAASAGHPIENLVLVEGIFDALRLHEEGIATCAALGGTGVSSRVIDQLERLSTSSVTLAFDRDEAGAEATFAALEGFRHHGTPITVDVLTGEHLRDCKDPDEFVQRYGADVFQGTLERRIAGSVFLAERILSSGSVKGHSRNERVFRDEVAKLYVMLPHTTRGYRERSELLEFVARRTTIPEATLRECFENALREERGRRLAAELRSALQRAALELRTIEPRQVAASVHQRLGELLRG